MTTFGLASLKMTIAPDTTKDSSPRVIAFHVFSAIRAIANGTRNVVLNFKPKTNGSTTFLTNPRPERNENFKLIRTALIIVRFFPILINSV